MYQFIPSCRRHEVARSSPRRPPAMRTVLPVLASALCLLALTGAVGAQKGPAQDPARVPVQTVWPLPPDQPRVRYVTAYRNAEDVGAARRSKSSSFKAALLGRDRTAAERTDPNGLNKPFGVVVDGFGRIIVTDSAQPAVVVLDPERHQFLPIGEGTRQAHFKVPIGLAVDAANNIYVGDTGLNRVLVFGPDLAFAGALGEAGEVKAPSGLAVDDARRRLYVVDSKLHRMIVYNLDTRTVEARVGSRGAADGQFNYPTGVAVAPDGTVYVTDTMNCRVQAFGPDLRFLRSFGSLGVRPGQFRRPKGIAVDAEGVVYVVDSDFNNFQMFTADGQPLMWVGEMGTRLGQLLLPAGIAVDRTRRRILVTEQYNKRLQVFERIGPAPSH
jgi:DNA-binding beta-propeller fold protein YncE